MPACRLVHLSGAQNVPACRGVVNTARGGMFARSVSAPGHYRSGAGKLALAECKARQLSPADGEPRSWRGVGERWVEGTCSTWGRV